MKKISTQFVLIVGFMAISACGGGSSDEPITTTLPDPNNQTSSVTEFSALSDTSAGTSDITAFGLFSNTETGERSFRSNGGKFTHANGSATITGQNVSEIVPFSAGSSDTAEYDYLRSFQTTMTIDGTVYDVNAGILGVPTLPAEMPTSGTATYKGGFTGVLSQASGTGFDLTNGSSTLAVNFDENTSSVDATFTSFTGNNQNPNSSAKLPIDTIKIDNMTISGNTFSGGALTTTLNGETVDITGTNTSTTAMGGFFGPSNPNPAEVGGGFLSQGDSGILTGSFAGSASVQLPIGGED